MRALRDPLEGVKRIGTDEISYRKGHRYLTVVVDHDSGRLLWAHPGHDEKTLRKFFRLIGKERRAAIKLVSADAAPWIANVVRPFVRVARAIRKNRDAIDCALAHGLSNARVEGVNTKLKLLTRLAYGFRSHAPLVALAMVNLGGLCPSLPQDQ